MTYHIPVLVNEVIDFLQVKPGGVYVDATLGGGGHAYQILTKADNVKLYGFDQDQDAVNYASDRLKAFSNNIKIFNKNFIDFRSSLALEKINYVDGILFDIGVSNYQITNPDKGFSFMEDSPLDMRMDKNSELTAEYIVNNYSLDELKKMFFEFGEENYSAYIANAIVYHRNNSPISRTSELSKIIEKSLSNLSDKHSVEVNTTKSKARIFQALRIAVNNELGVLESALQDAIYSLNTGARLVVISWHSLEDRIVKQLFQKESTNCICSKEIPQCICNHKALVKILTKKPVTPTEEEVNQNSNARSAKLRVVEKLGRNQ